MAKMASTNNILGSFCGTDRGSSSGCSGSEETRLVGAALGRIISNSGLDSLRMGKGSFTHAEKDALQPYALALRSLGHSWEEIRDVFTAATGRATDASTLYRRYRHADNARLASRANVLDICNALEKVLPAPPDGSGESQRD